MNYVVYLEDIKKNNPNQFNIEYEKVKNKLFKEHCIKKSYKDICEPSYCAFAYDNTCKYLSEMRKIWSTFNIKDF